jgi:uncharacterized protein
MIHSFSCENFYSFKDRMELSFVVDENAPDKATYVTDETGTRVSLLETVIGPNASGKTNLLKVIPVIKWLLIDSWNETPNSEIPIKPFMTKSEDDLTKLGVVFSLGESIFEYDIHLTTKKIYYEKLVERSMTVERRTAKVLFERSWSKEDSNYQLSLANFNTPPGFEALVRENATAISTALRLNHSLSQRITNYWQAFDFNVKERGYIGDQVFGSHEALFGAVNFFHINKELKNKADEILQKFDLGLTSFNIEESNNHELQISVMHKFGDKQLPIQLDYESSGTRKLYGLLKIILVALTNGSVAIIDEFDANLHPDMVQELVSMFSDESLNTQNAQLLFSTHSHRILAQLDKYQIVLTEKAEDGQTESWRLDEVKGVRADENYYTKYIAGAYGGVPDIG